MSTITVATAGVERYQFTTVDITVDSVNGNDNYTHSFTLVHNPCDDEWTAEGKYTGAGGPWGETVTVLAAGPDYVSMKAVYDTDGYQWSPAFILEDGTLTFAEEDSTDNVDAATGTYTMTQSDYNHGEYVAESVDEYGPDARSCIGMPIVSNGKS